eukprot:gene1858-3604_t
MKNKLLFVMCIFSLKADIKQLVDAKSWSMEELGSKPRDKDFTFAELLTRNSIIMRENGCLSHTNATLHSVNEWIDRKNIKSIPGTTFWINECLAPGHMHYDVQLLQVLRTTKIDQIILQRAPCARPDFCQGIGNWGSFFKGLYTTMVDALNYTEIPVYIRFSPNDTVWTPYMVGSRTGKSITNLALQTIPATENLCFEKVIRKACNQCFHNSISVDTARAFKRAAYAILSPGDLPSPSSTNNLIVTIAHRGSHKRHLANREDLASTLRSRLPPSVTVRMFDTTNETLMTHLNQVKVAAESDVMIATHGAFISNVIYMREGTLLIEINGNYTHAEPYNFQILTKNFLVNHRSIIAYNLTLHSTQYFYLLNDFEIIELCNTVCKYLDKCDNV